MSAFGRQRLPRWFVPVAALALVWNLIGVAFYLGQVGAIGALAPPEPAVPMPGWVLGAYATGVFAGAVGSLGLMLKRGWARPLLWLSLAALIVNWGWVFFASGAGIQPLGLVVLAVALLLVWMGERLKR